MPETEIVRVLIVEDEATDAEILKRSLQRLELPSMEISLARNGAQARGLFQRSRYDLILLDLHLPDVVGYELIHEAKKHQKDVSVVVCTSLNSEDAALEVGRIGADDYIVKDDLLGSSLGRTVRRLLRHRLEQLQNAGRSSKLIEEASDVIDTWLAWRFPTEKVPPKPPQSDVLEETRLRYRDLLALCQGRSESELHAALKKYEDFCFAKKIPAETLIDLHKDLCNAEPNLGGPGGRPRYLLFELLAGLLERYRS